MVPADRGLRCGLDWGTCPSYEDVEFHMRVMARWGHAFVARPALQVTSRLVPQRVPMLVEAAD
jgi:hypothetical protein